MAEAKNTRPRAESDHVVDRAKDFWNKYGRMIMIVSGAVILLGGGWLAYKYLIKAPKEQKAAEAIWKTEDFFIQDSIQKTLKGDGQFPGAEKIANEYDGTKAGNLADYYAGSMALKAGEFDKAIKHLKDFSTDAKQIQARAYKLLGDAYASVNKNAEALSSYKKAAKEFEDDKQNASEYLFMAAYLADRVLNDKKQAIELYSELVKKYPESQWGVEAQRYLGQAGVYKTED